MIEYMWLVYCIVKKKWIWYGELIEIQWKFISQVKSIGDTNTIFLILVAYTMNLETKSIRDHRHNWSQTQGKERERDRIFTVIRINAHVDYVYTFQYWLLMNSIVSFLI